MLSIKTSYSEIQSQQLKIEFKYYIQNVYIRYTFAKHLILPQITAFS